MKLVFNLDIKLRLPEVGVAFASARVVDQKAGEGRADHAADGGVDPLQPIVRVLLPQDRDYRALEHGEGRPSDHAYEHPDGQIAPESQADVICLFYLEVRANFLSRSCYEAPGTAAGQLHGTVGILQRHWNAHFPASL